MENNPLGNFTFAGRLLIVSCLIFQVGGTAGSIFWWADDLAPGRYPVFMFAGPVLVLVIAYAVAFVAVCRWLNIALRKPDESAGPLESDFDESLDD